MDELKLGEAIATAVNSANAKMLPEVMVGINQMIAAAQSGVFVEVPSAEMAEKLSCRAKQLRARAEEIVSAPSEVTLDARGFSGLPPHLRQYGGADDEATLCAQREQMLKREIANRKAMMEALMTDAERLDFMAAHLPKDQTFRLDRRELDDLFFGDRNLGATTGLIY